MCYVCCKEFRGWLKSFTRIEALVSILEAVLLVVLLSFLVFLILHFLVCSQQPEVLKMTEQKVRLTPSSPPRRKPKPATFPPQIECTWKPSEKTTAGTRYYLSHSRTTTSSGTTAEVYMEENDYIDSTTELSEITDEKHWHYESMSPETEDTLTEEYDAELADSTYKKYVLALVKLKPPGDLTFGCILTIITEHWTLTAASCIESIEEVDSLDSFFMMEDYGEVNQGKSHALSDVRIHPFYQGVNRSYDLAALRSEDVLVRGHKDAVHLPNIVDYFLVAIGERFVALGYGGYRSVEVGARARRLRQVGVFTLSAAQCPGAGDDEAWATRHLVPAEAGAHAGSACGAAALCAGALWARGTPCGHCAGTPLLRGPALYGVMGRNPHCAVTCEPQLYVNLAAARPWIDSILD